MGGVAGAGAGAVGDVLSAAEMDDPAAIAARAAGEVGPRLDKVKALEARIVFTPGQQALIEQHNLGLAPDGDGLMISVESLVELLKAELPKMDFSAIARGKDSDTILGVFQKYILREFLMFLESSARDSAVDDYDDEIARDEPPSGVRGLLCEVHDNMVKAPVAEAEGDDITKFQYFFARAYESFLGNDLLGKAWDATSFVEVFAWLYAPHNMASYISPKYFKATVQLIFQQGLQSMSPKNKTWFSLILADIYLEGREKFASMKHLLDGIDKDSVTTILSETKYGQCFAKIVRDMFESGLALISAPGTSDFLVEWLILTLDLMKQKLFPHISTFDRLNGRAVAYFSAFKYETSDDRLQLREYYTERGFNMADALSPSAYSEPNMRVATSALYAQMEAFREICNQPVNKAQEDKAITLYENSKIHKDAAGDLMGQKRLSETDLKKLRYHYCCLRSVYHEIDDMGLGIVQRNRFLKCGGNEFVWDVTGRIESVLSIHQKKTWILPFESAAREKAIRQVLEDHALEVAAELEGNNGGAAGAAAGGSKARRKAAQQEKRRAKRAAAATAEGSASAAAGDAARIAANQALLESRSGAGEAAKSGGKLTASQKKRARRKAAAERKAAQEAQAAIEAANAVAAAAAARSKVGKEEVDDVDDHNTKKSRKPKESKTGAVASVLRGARRATRRVVRGAQGLAPHMRLVLDPKNGAVKMKDVKIAIKADGGEWREKGTVIKAIPMGSSGLLGRLVTLHKEHKGGAVLTPGALAELRRSARGDSFSSSSGSDSD